MNVASMCQKINGIVLLCPNEESNTGTDSVCVLASLHRKGLLSERIPKVVKAAFKSISTSECLLNKYLAVIRIPKDKRYLLFNCCVHY